MQHYATFHLGLHCLPKYLFIGLWEYKGLIMTCINLPFDSGTDKQSTHYL